MLFLVNFNLINISLCDLPKRNVRKYNLQHHYVNGFPKDRNGRLVPALIIGGLGHAYTGFDSELNLTLVLKQKLF